MLSLNKSYKNRKVSFTIHCKYKYFDSTVQRAEDRRQKFYFCRLPFAVNAKLNLSNNLLLTEREGRTGEYWPEVVAVRTERIQNDGGPIFPGTVRAS